MHWFGASRFTRSTKFSRSCHRSAAISRAAYASASGSDVWLSRRKRSASSASPLIRIRSCRRNCTAWSNWFCAVCASCCLDRNDGSSMARSFSSSGERVGEPPVVESPAAPVECVIEFAVSAPSAASVLFVLCALSASEDVSRRLCDCVAVASRAPVSPVTSLSILPTLFIVSPVVLLASPLPDFAAKSRIAAMPLFNAS